jgi:hypothetical protein
MKYEINTKKIVEGANELAKLKMNELEKISLDLMKNAEKEIAKIKTWKESESRKNYLIEEIAEITVNRVGNTVNNTKFYFHKLNEALTLCGREMANLREYNQEAMNVLKNTQNKLQEYVTENAFLNIQN